MDSRGLPIPELGGPYGPSETIQHEYSPELTYLIDKTILIDIYDFMIYDCLIYEFIQPIRRPIRLRRLHTWLLNYPIAAINLGLHAIIDSYNKNNIKFIIMTPSDRMITE